MNKILITFSIMFSFLFSNIFSEAHEIPKPTPEEKQKTKKTNWQPWAVSIVSALIAGTGIYLVATHKGNKNNIHK